MPAPKGPRPITRALSIAKKVRKNLVDYIRPTNIEADIDEIIKLLEARDASSDTPDVKRSKPRRKTARTPARTTR